MKKDKILGCISVAFGALFALLTVLTVDPTLRIENDPGARIFPYIISAMFVVLGIVLLVRPEGNEKIYLTGAQWKRLLQLFLVLCAYFFLMWLIGFVISTLALLYMVSTMFAMEKDTVWWHRLIFAVITTIVIWVAFKFGLKVLLPVGLIPGLL